MSRIGIDGLVALRVRASALRRLAGRSIRMAAVVFLLAIGHGAATLAADPSEYCGLYAVYGASVAMGKPVKFSELLNVKYIGSHNGSSASELVAALSDFGFSATVISGLGVETLRTSAGPIILHIAAGEQLAAYNHWILFLGCEGDRAIVVDSVDGKQSVALAQILARWDGNAILVGNEKRSLVDIKTRELFLYFQYALIILAMVVLAGALQRRYWPSVGGQLRSCGIEAAVILFIGASTGMLYHTLDPGVGFLRNPGPTSFIAVAHIEGLMPKRSLAEVQELMRSGSVVPIDARFARDFEAGHLPGARSLPIDATAKQRTVALANLSYSQPIVVYCQSADCSFQDVVANSLIREGFKNVALFPGGWVEWKSGGARKPSKAAGSSFR